MEVRPLISTSPQIHAAGTTRAVMAWVLIALAPVSIWSVFLFGIRSVLVLAVSIISAVAVEALLNWAFQRENSIGDLSAGVTGLLVGLNMPPSVPLFIPMVASAFGIAVVKWSFGGLGANWMNPALAGRVFVFFSWGSAMTEWTLPRLGNSVGGAMLADTVAGATPLGTVKVALTHSPSGVDGPMRLLESAGVPMTYSDLFFGRMSGSLGEMSALLLLAGGLLLILLKIVNWEIPLMYLGGFALLIWVFDGRTYGSGLFTGDVMFHLLTGGLMLGALFMATDLATTPLTRKGRIIFGLGCGFLTFVIRKFGSFPEGVSLAIILMNIFTPLINRFTKPVRYGGVS